MYIDMLYVLGLFLTEVIIISLLLKGMYQQYFHVHAMDNTVSQSTANPLLHSPITLAVNKKPL